MSNSSDVSAGDDILASQYNNLRADVLNTSTGHTHDGVDSKSVQAQYADMAIKIQTGSESLSLDAPVLVLPQSTGNTITFPTAFSSPPKISVIAYGITLDGGDNITYQVYNITSTSFDVDVFDITESNDPFTLHWVAIGA